MVELMYLWTLAMQKTDVGRFVNFRPPRHLHTREVTRSTSGTGLARWAVHCTQHPPWIKSVIQPFHVVNQDLSFAMSGGTRQVSIKHETSYRFPLENVRAVQTTVKNECLLTDNDDERKKGFHETKQQSTHTVSWNQSFEWIYTEMKTHGLHKESTTQR